MQQNTPARTAYLISTQWLKQFALYNLPLSLLLSLTFILPDHLMALFKDVNPVSYQTWMYFAIFGFSNLILLARKKAIIYSVLATFCIMETAHFCYMAYFGGIISASVILQFFMEFQDVFDVSMAYAQYLVYAPAIVIIPCLITFIMIRAYADRRGTIPLVWILFTLLILTVPYKIISQPDRAVRYMPNPAYPSMANSYLNLSILFFNHIPRLLLPGLYNQNNKQYLPVRVSETNIPDKMTIVFVMLESVTYDHMGLYGYHRPTTPFLNSLTNDDHFIWKQGISAGISTRVSLSSFWNNVRDPRNTNQFIKKSSNLFRLSAKHGFVNQYISAQTSNLLRDAGTEYIQKLVTKDMLSGSVKTTYDELLPELANNLELYDKNLIVFNTRTAHAPYKSNYKYYSKCNNFTDTDIKYERMILNSYDNAICYTDHILEKLFNIMKERVNGPLYFIVTSDHGQLFGENPEHAFGHGELVPKVGHVPVMYYALHGDNKYGNTLSDLKIVTHNELGQLLLKMTGYEMQDPNSENGIYYINGLGYHHGENGYIKVDVSNYPEREIKYDIYHKG